MSFIVEQIARLEREVKAWQTMRQQQMEAAQKGVGNAIQLTVRYPGMDKARIQVES